MKDSNTPLVSRRLAAVILYGALWGSVEATLGYALHLLRRIVPIPGMPGYILFPVGLLIMLAATKATGWRWAPLAVAAVAAAAKATTVALPVVSSAFVVNPTLAILAEGAAVTVATHALSFSGLPQVIGHTMLVAIGWRVIFILLLVALPVRGGILEKGTGALSAFVFLESAANAIVAGIAVALSTLAESREGAQRRRRLPFVHALIRLRAAVETPLAVPLALGAAVGLQLAAAAL